MHKAHVIIELMNQKGFGISATFIVLVVVSLLAFTGWLVYLRDGVSSSVTIKSNLLFELSSKGALNVVTGGHKINVAPWSLTVLSDGSGLLQCGSQTNYVSPCKTTAYPANTFAATSLTVQLPAIAHGYLLNCDAMHNPVPANLIYDGHTIQDIDCFVQSRYNTLARSLYAVYGIIGKRFVDGLTP